MGLLIGTLLAAGASVYLGSTFSKSSDRYNAQKELKEKLQSDPILKQMDLDTLINRAADIGYITKSDKTRYLTMLKDFDERHGLFDAGLDLSGKDTEEIARLYGVLTKVAPEIGEILNNYTGVDVKQSIIENIPAIADAPSPGYFDVDFQSEWENREADPLKWWTGEELADHHDLDWDLDSMYNNVKAGTSANVDAVNYASDYMREAGLKDRTQSEVSYLTGLRNTKSDAISAGATAGTRAANELLGLTQAGSDFAETQSEIANQRWNAVNNALLTDAEARLTANQQFQNLGLNIADNIEYLFANDVDRRGAELNSYANLFAADEALRQANIQANADMYKNYAVAQANINSARQSALDTTNRYAWMWDRFYGRAKESGYDDTTARALANNDYFNWVSKEATNTQSYRSLRTQQDQSY